MIFGHKLIEVLAMYEYWRQTILEVLQPALQTGSEQPLIMFRKQAQHLIQRNRIVFQVTRRIGTQMVFPKRSQIGTDM